MLISPAAKQTRRPVLPINTETNKPKISLEKALQNWRGLCWQKVCVCGQDGAGFGTNSSLPVVI